MNSQPYNLGLVGSVRPPTDMIDAARKSLSEAGFNDLIAQTGGAPPTSAQLVAAVELERSQSSATA